MSYYKGKYKQRKCTINKREREHIKSDSSVGFQSTDELKIDANYIHNNPSILQYAHFHTQLASPDPLNTVEQENDSFNIKVKPQTKPSITAVPDIQQATKRITAKRDASEVSMFHAYGFSQNQEHSRKASIVQPIKLEQVEPIVEGN